jgi:biopolymer transport protein ExbD
MPASARQREDANSTWAEASRSRIRRRMVRPRLVVNLTSLIDVTFLLLIYFMVATSMSMGEEAYRMDLPQASSGSRGGESSDPFELDDEPLHIRVATTGPRAEDYQVRIDGPYSQPATFEALHQFLRQHQINPENAGAGALVLFEPDVPVIIEPSAGTRWDHAMEAFSAAARAKYTQITFAAVE